MTIFDQQVLLLVAACIALMHEGHSTLLPIASRFSLVKATGRTVFTSSYMRSADAHYYVAGHTVSTVTSGPTNTDNTGRPFIEKHLLSKDNYVWRYAIDANNTRISSMASNARGTSMFVAGHSHELGTDGNFVQRLFLAEINTGWTGPKLGKVVVGEPVAFLRVNKIVAEGAYVFLCGRSVGLGNSSFSGSYALMYSSSLSLKWRTQSEGGSSRAFCSDILLSRGATTAYKLVTKFDLKSDKERTHGYVQVFEPPTGRELWSVALKPEAVKQLAFLPNIASDTVQATNGSSGTEHNLSLEKLLEIDSALFVSVRISLARDKSYAYNVILKMSSETGLVLWAQAILLPPTYKHSMGYIRPAGIVHAADDYIYTLSRYRDVSYTYASIAARVSIFQDFSESKDISSPLWHSNSSACATVGVVYSNLRGTILAFGKSSLISNSTTANATYVELPIGPATNNGAHVLCLGCNGPEFVHICFDLVTSNATLLSLNSTREMLREMFRLYSYQLTPEEGTAKKNGEEESKDYCVLLRGEDLGRLQQELQSRIRTFVFDLGADGRNAIERRFNAPPKTIFFRDNNLMVKSKGIISKKQVSSKRRSLKDIADDFMRDLTIAGICAALVGTSLVMLAIIFGRVLEALKKKRSGSGSVQENEREASPKRS